MKEELLCFICFNHFAREEGEFKVQKVENGEQNHLI